MRRLFCDIQINQAYYSVFIVGSFNLYQICLNCSLQKSSMRLIPVLQGVPGEKLHGVFGIRW
jgi:hypothetical protein